MQRNLLILHLGESRFKCHWMMPALGYVQSGDLLEVVTAGYPLERPEPIDE